MLPQNRNNIIRVLLADDSAVILKAVRMLLAEDSGIQVVGEVASKKDLFPYLHRVRPDVLVMDLHMCAERGVIQALKEIPGLELVVMSALVGPDSMDLAARLGLNEVLEKAELPDTLVNAVKYRHSQRQTRRVRVAVAS